MIGKVKVNLVKLWIGTALQSTLISPCLDIYQPNCTNSNTNPHHVPNMPHIHKINQFTEKIQLDTQQRYTPKLNSADTNCVQFINDTFLYYARAVYPTMLPDPNNISTRQYAPI